MLKLTKKRSTPNTANGSDRYTIREHGRFGEGQVPSRMYGGATETNQKLPGMSKLYLLYHELRSLPSPYSYVMETARFEEHCRLYSAPQAVADGTTTPEITFDDGHFSNHTLAAPLLHQHNLKAMFFITAGWVSHRTDFMSWDQIRELSAQGHTIGAHGMTHQLLTHCSGQELDREIRGARERLEDGLGHPITTMSLPGGRGDQRVLAACWDAGYTEVFTSTPRIEPSSRPAHSAVGRLNVRSSITAEWLEQALRSESGIVRKLERQDHWKAAAKNLLGDRLYAKIWAAVNRQEAEADDASMPDPGTSGG